MGRSNFEETRRLLLTETIILKWLHINNVFESANVSSLIYVSRKTKARQYSFCYQKAEDILAWKQSNEKVIVVDSFRTLESEFCRILFAENDKLEILDYLKAFPAFESTCIVWRGEEVGKKASTIERINKNGLLPILSGEDVHRYKVPIPTKWIHPQNVKKHVAYSSSKLLIRQLGDRINATIDEVGIVSTQSVYSVLPLENSEENRCFMLGLLNSSLFNFIYGLMSGDKQTFKRIILENVKSLPMPKKVLPSIRRDIAVLVTKRLRATSKENALFIEHCIDELVFQLYDIPERMVKVVLSC